MSSSHPFNPGEHKYSLFLPLGGMIILGIVTTTAGFVFWPDPKPHHDISTEGYFPDHAVPGSRCLDDTMPNAPDADGVLRPGDPDCDPRAANPSPDPGSDPSPSPSLHPSEGPDRPGSGAAQ